MGHERKDWWGRLAEEMNGVLSFFERMFNRFYRLCMCISYTQLQLLKQNSKRKRVHS